MKSQRALMAVSAALLTSVAGTLAGVNPETLPAATREMVALYPGVEVAMDQGRVRTIAGVPMTSGKTPQQAVDNFLAAHGDALGVPQLDLRPLWQATMADGKREVFAYQQYIGNLPVEYGTVRIMTAPADKGRTQRVMFWGGTPAPFGEAALQPALVTADQALAIVKTQKLYSSLDVWSVPEQVVWQGNGQWITPVRVWKFTGEVLDPNVRRKLTFFVNTLTGLVVHVRNDVIYTDVTGSVVGKATPGMNPDVASNPPTVQQMPEIRIGIFGDLPGYTDTHGDYSLVNTGTTPVSVTTAVGPGAGTGRWCWISNNGGNELTLTQNVTPGNPATGLFTFNNVPGGANSLTTAQVNAFIHTNKIHNFYRDRSGTWNLIDSSLRVNTNLNQTCNAFYDGASTNFFKTGGGCPNTAYSDVVAHEYGHHVVNRLGLGQGGFGEGFADSGALLLYDTTVLGLQFMNGNPVRTPLADNITFPCSPSCGGEPHCCGEILGAVWIKIRQNMGTKYGAAPGLVKTQQLFVDWMLIATGGTGDGFANSANENTAIEVLTVNDDNGDLSDGTPDYAPIAKAFKAQLVPVPTAPPLFFSFPNGLPGLTQANTPVTILMNVDEMSRVPQANTGKIVWRINNGSWTTSNMTQTTTNHYSFTIAGQPCDSVVDFYFQATAAATINPVQPALVVNFPSNAPSALLYYPVAESISVVTQDDMEIDNGWVVGVPDDTATTGIWVRDIPQATAAQPGSDHTSNGSRCFVTDNRAGQQVSDYDVDGGKTTLTSPMFDVTGLRHPRVNFWLWYSNDVGSFNPNTNTFSIDVSPNNGLSWTTLRTLGPSGSETHGKWRFYDLAIDAPVAYTNQMRVRFVASDITGAIVEAAVDDFQVTSLVCNIPCYANCDNSTAFPILNVNDFQCFLNRFGTGDTWANCDGSTTVPVLNINDFNCFLNAYASGCP